MDRKRELFSTTGGRFQAFALTALLSLLASPTLAREIDWAQVQEEAVGYLSRYLAIDTSNPPGRTDEAAAFLKGILERDSIPVKIFNSGEGRHILLARLRSPGTGRKPLLLLHHMDVVPADPDLWAHPPFGGVQADGYLWGRGALDMKGMGILELIAFLLVNRQGLELDRDLLYLAVPDEETGGQRGAGWMVEKHWERLDPEYVWDEGLTGTRGLLTDQGVVWGISVVEKKVFWIRLIAEGTAGHGSQPHQDNPVDHLVRAIGRLAEHRFALGRTAVVAELFERLGELAANKFTNAVQRNTCSLTTLNAGVGRPAKVNVIPSRAEATLDCRILPSVPPEAFLEELKGILGRQLFETGKLRFETLQVPEEVGLSTSFDSELFRTMEQVAVGARSGSVAVPVQVPWGTDSRYFRERGVKAYGFTPVIVNAEELGKMHGVDERISLDNVGLGSRLIYRVIESFATR